VWRKRARCVVRLGPVCGAFGSGVWCVWVRCVVRLGPVCGGLWCVGLVRRVLLTVLWRVPQAPAVAVDT